MPFDRSHSCIISFTFLPFLTFHSFSASRFTGYIIHFSILVSTDMWFCLSHNMLDTLAFPLHFTWISISNDRAHRVIRIQYDSARNETMTLDDGDILILEVEKAKLFEFVVFVSYSSLSVSKSHGIRGLINPHELEQKLHILREFP